MADGNTKGLAWTLAILTAILCYQVKGCDDVSRKACQQLMSQNTGLCNDACLSSVCQRSCGKCALRCFSCHEVDDISQCNTTIECPSTDHQCISVKSFNSQFKEVYKLGCAFGSICDSDSLETSCCTHDLCNNKHSTTTVKTTTTSTVPSTTTTQATPSPTTTTPPTTTADSSGVLLVGKRQSRDSLCVESSPPICQELVASDPNVCSMDCIKSMCPVSCGKCKTCYDCSYVADSDLCNMTSVCNHDELCYGLETVNSYSEHGFRLGCAPQQVCDSIASISTNTFGRRSPRSLIGGCCGDNLCNTHIKPITTTPQPTTVSSTTPSTTTEDLCSCPPNAFTYNKECFFVSDTAFTRNDAKSFCQSHCANLARFQSSTELNAIEREMTNYFRQHSTGRRFIYDTLYGVGYRGVYIDAVYDSRRHWVWETTQGRISHDVFRNQTNPHHEHCAVSYYFLRSHIRPVDCDTHHYALCLLDRSSVH